MNFTDLKDLLDSHPGWNKKLLKVKKKILKEAEECEKDSCLTKNDVLMLKEFFKNVNEEKQ